MPSPSVALVALIIGIALVFDFTNGFHDSANAISTIVSTRVLSPRTAVAFAAFFNFIAAFGFGVAVASTVSKIINLDHVDPDIVPYIVLAALVGAIAWNLITWLAGLPTSSSHALIGALAGAGIAAAGVAAVKLSTVLVVAEFMVISPVIGLVAGFLFMAAVLWLTRHLHREQADHHFRRLQLLSSGAYCFSHGTNDAQKTMGIITPLLFSIGYYGAEVDPGNLPIPSWVILSAYTAIALGTLFGGWRIVKTMGYKITKLRPVHGFSAQSVSAGTILAMSHLGIPVSTTHIISTAIMGVGTTKGPGAVRWGIARNIVGAWVLTIPASAAIGFAAFWALGFVI